MQGLTELSARAGHALLPAAFLLVIVLAAPASATPPSAMSLSYDPAGSVLSVSITHPSLNIPHHYIREVTITVNGAIANDSFYTSQPGGEFTYTYPLALRPGDVVETTAACSLSGSATRSFTVPGPAAVAPAGPAGTTASGRSQATAPAPAPKASVPAIAAAAAAALVAAFRRKG